MTNTNTNKNIQQGDVVQFVVNGKIMFFGKAEYITHGWVGIRQPSGRIDEAPISHVEIDPT